MNYEKIKNEHKLFLKNYKKMHKKIKKKKKNFLKNIKKMCLFIFYFSDF